tara:strand:+ start:102 stop:374 length:273 start_codon:yes stop_codon:yes gene_type:complete
VYQCVKIGIKREYKSRPVASNFYFRSESDTNSVYSVMMMDQRKLDMLVKLKESWKYEDENRKFALPGMLSANKSMPLAFKNLRSPLKNYG